MAILFKMLRGIRNGYLFVVVCLDVERGVVRVTILTTLWSILNAVWVVGFSSVFSTFRSLFFISVVVFSVAGLAAGPVFWIFRAVLPSETIFAFVVLFFFVPLVSPIFGFAAEVFFKFLRCFMLSFGFDPDDLMSKLLCEVFLAIAKGFEVPSFFLETIFFLSMALECNTFSS